MRVFLCDFIPRGNRRFVYDGGLCRKFGANCLLPRRNAVFRKDELSAFEKFARERAARRNNPSAFLCGGEYAAVAACRAVFKGQCEKVGGF